MKSGNRRRGIASAQSDRLHPFSLGVTIFTTVHEEHPLRIHVGERDAESPADRGREAALDLDGPDPVARQLQHDSNSR